MRAVIMEIYKDYCIVMTQDGQFLKQGIPAGVFEIGDEIVVSEGYAYRPKLAKIGWMKNFAVGTMVVVIVAVVSIFGIWYLKQYRPSREVALLTGDSTGEELTAQIEEEEPEEEAEESVTSMKAGQEETIIFDNIYSFEEAEKVEVDINGIIFSYEIIDNVNLRVKLENKRYTPAFNGTFNLVMLFSDGSDSRMETISLERFEPGMVRERPLFLKVGETDMRLVVTAITY